MISNTIILNCLSSSRAEPLTLTTTDALGWMILNCEGCSAYWEVSSIPDLYQLVAKSTPSCDNHKYVHNFSNVLWGREKNHINILYLTFLGYIFQNKSLSVLSLLIQNSCTLLTPG